MGGKQLATVAVGRDPGAMVVEIGGEVDLSNADDIRAQVVAAAATSPEPVAIIDLARVDYLDSTGVRMIDEIRDALRAGGRDMWLRVPPGAKSLRIIELTGMGGLILR